jgi:hypothetical protein
MSAELHLKAQRLIERERVEGISTGERELLTGHLRECEGCAAFARKTEAAVRSLRGMAIPFPKDLASRTQFRVRLRAQEMREREPGRRWIWAACGISWALGVASAPYVWQALQWVGAHTGAPKIVLQLSFGLWWAIPALVAAGVALLENARQSAEPEYSTENQ